VPLELQVDFQSLVSSTTDWDASQVVNMGITSLN